MQPGSSKQVDITVTEACNCVQHSKDPEKEAFSKLGLNSVAFTEDRSGWTSSPIKRGILLAVKHQAWRHPHLAGKDTAKGKEAALVRAWNHF